MTLGKVLVTAAMARGLHVTGFPSYGAEVRGGTAHTMVRISSQPVAGPIVTLADTAIIMNGPSLEKFENAVVPGGLLILNTSIVRRKAARDDIYVSEAPLTEEAIKLGNVRVANMIAAGIFAAKKEIVSKEDLIHAMKKIAAGREDLIPVNVRAVEKGMEIAGKDQEGLGTRDWGIGTGD